jgi:hypothetical protein
MPSQLVRQTPAQLRQLVSDGKVLRNGYAYDWGSKPSHEMVEISTVFLYETTAGETLYVVFGKFGHQQLVSIQNATMRREGRLVMYFRVEEPSRLLARGHDFRRYAKIRLKIEAEELVPMIATLIERGV